MGKARAIEAILFSIGNGYTGIFEPKEQTTATTAQPKTLDPSTNRRAQAANYQS